MVFPCPRQATIRPATRTATPALAAPDATSGAPSAGSTKSAATSPHPCERS